MHFRNIYRPLPEVVALGVEMSTRSYQRLAGDAEIIRIPARSGERKGRRKPRTDTSVEEETHEGGPFSHEGLLARKQKAANSMNPFAMGMVRSVFVCTSSLSTYCAARV